MSATEFSGLDFAAGSVKGIRSFRVDQYGRLTGVSHQKVWTPGENNAECLVGPGSIQFYFSSANQFAAQISQAMAAMYSLNQSFSVPAWTPDEPTQEPSEEAEESPQPKAWKEPVYPHQVTKPEDYKRPKNKKKPRAERQPDPAWDPAPALTHSGEVVIARSWLLGGDAAQEAPAKAHDFASCSCGYYAYYDGSNEHSEAGTVTAIVEGYGECLIGTRGFRAVKARILALHLAWGSSSKHANAVQLLKVRRNYPDVPVFDSLVAMVEAFPPDVDLGPSPESDPDFWTRS